jgi:geranylgeranyl diphosphate synthase type II
LIEKVLDGFLPGEDEFPQALHKAMRYSVFAGGKRVRPVMAMAAADVVGDGSADVTGVACAVELIHTYSLIHDDLPAMDNDDLRRGKPTCHKVFGEATAILAGDALLTLAFAMIVCKTSDRPSQAIMSIKELVGAAGSFGMVGGQVVDIESEGRDIAFPVLEYIHIHKTGLLIRAAVRCGAMVAGANGKELDALTKYGDAVGLAFQIADDILDVEGDTGLTGKNVGGDAKKGKATYPAVIGLKDSRKRADELVEKGISALEILDDKAEPLREIARYIVKRKK